MRDTTPEAAKIQTEILRGLTGEQRLRTAFASVDYGTARATQDIDLVIAPTAEDIVIAKLGLQDPWSAALQAARSES